MSWIETYSGRKFDFANPTPDMVSIEGIAHALAHNNRFTGHTSRPYSVAEHSINVAGLVAAPDRFAALMHDATEAYIADISSPAKAMLPDYRKLEKRIWSVIAEKFDLPEKLPDSVKWADWNMLFCERECLLSCKVDWELQKPEPYLFQRVSLSPVEPGDIKAQFLRKFEEYRPKPAVNRIYGQPARAASVAG